VVTGCELLDHKSLEAKPLQYALPLEAGDGIWDVNENEIGLCELEVAIRPASELLSCVEAKCNKGDEHILLHYQQ
jgi:hypothetical protein